MLDGAIYGGGKWYGGAENPDPGSGFGT